MGLLAVMMGLGGPPAFAADLPPSDHTLVYYNARLALREDQPLEAVKLWLLRNALEDQTAEVSPYDVDFRSVTWAALGDLGICQDGQPLDDDGVGLWPLAMHNWVVKNMGRRDKPRRPKTFDSFEVGRQQRLISITDVLSTEELKTVRLVKGRCLRPKMVMLASGESFLTTSSDRQLKARFLRYLLHKAQLGLDGERVRGFAAIEARLFDLDLQLTALASREALKNTREQAQRASQLGLSRESVAALKAEAPVTTLNAGSEAARILEECVDWPVSEWMTLSPARRRFVFWHAIGWGGDKGKLDTVAIGVIDELLVAGDGEEVEAWLGLRRFLEPESDPAAAWSGARGEALLGLDRESGFRERGVIALHRGVAHLERGELPEAMRALALALQLAPDSRAGEEVQGLSRRWLSYVAAQFQITDELLVTLQELVPARDYGIILEDLMWGAALRADQASFDRGVRNQLGRGALERRLALLRPLAAGDVGRFATLIRTRLVESPSETLRLLDQLVQHIELEDADVREAQRPTLLAVHRLLQDLAEQGAEGGRQGRAAASLVSRSQAILEGLGGLGAEASARDRARSLAPGAEVFAGSVRLAPADPLPWPFRTTEPPAPSAFSPLDLTPVEWRDEAGELVFGWRVGG